MKNIHSIRDFELKNKRLFLRLDLNVPLTEPDESGQRHVQNDNRIQEALPVIQHARANGARVILASHLGRPQGNVDAQFSLEPVARTLAHALETDVVLAEDYLSEGFEMMVKSMKSGEIILLENLRFHGAEEANQPEFCHALARFCDLYINDAFGTAHRKHASVYGLPRLVEKKGVGFLIEKELHFLSPLLNAPKKPFHLILGGAKVSDKIKTIHRLLRSIDALFIGGAMAHAFTKAKGKSLPDNAKKPSPEDIEAAKQIIKETEKRELPLHLPIDMNASFDIGEKTIALFTEKLQPAKTVFWNGPLGWFENEAYAKGTLEIAKALAKTNATKIVGGGDTVAAVLQSGVASQFDHLSTGGGAVLKFLEGKGLPGIDVLTFNPNRAQSSVLEPEDD